MNGEFERGDPRMIRCDERKFLQIECSCFLQVALGFVDRFALGCRARFRIQRDEAAFIRVRENRRELHDASLECLLATFSRSYCGCATPLL